MNDVLRIALCQLECHPSFFIDKLAINEEPFIPEKTDFSLSSLSGSGLPGVIDLKNSNKTKYLNWQLKRIAGILSHPLLNDDVPCLLSFPEGSIPFQALPIIADYSSKAESVVIAGTHGIQNTVDARRVYRSLNREKSIYREKPSEGQVSFVFVGSKIYSRNKSYPSIFELTDISETTNPPMKLYPYIAELKNLSFRFLPLVCSEALQNPNVHGDFQVANIISYAPKPEFFDPYIDTQSQLSRICTFLNDGRYGCSGIMFPLDRRHNSWFFNAPLRGRLPKGDCLLIIDISLNNIAPKAGVVNPGKNYEIKKLCSIVYEESSLPNLNVAKELAEIGNLQQAEARYSRLSKLLRRGPSDPCQKARIEYLCELSRNGLDHRGYWERYGEDIFLGQEGLIELEGNLASNCYNCLLPLILKSDIDPETEKNLKLFVKKCDEKKIDASQIEDATCETESPLREDTIDRDTECNRILSFFDSATEIGIQITGLMNIGKTSTISKSISQTGLKKILKIEISESSTIQFIYEKLIENPWHVTPPSDKEIFELLSNGVTKNKILEWDLIWFQDCENLLTGGNWRSDEIDVFFSSLINILTGNNTKVMFESTYELPIKTDDPSIIGKLRIKGIEKQLKEFGVALLNKQLRRLDFSPSDLNQSDKERIINRLGGHPLAIIYCADAIYEKGFTDVVEAMEKGSGFYQKVINKILQYVTLTSEQKLILQLLEGSDIDVHRDLLSSVCPFPVSDHLNSCKRSRGVSDQIQARSGGRLLNHALSIFSRTRKVDLDRSRQVSFKDRIRSTQRLPLSLCVPRLRFRHSTPKRKARSARLLVGSTPG